MNGLFDKHDFFADKASVPSRLAWGDPQKCPDPHVTVIMPVYRRPDYFAKALASVLQQDYPGAYEVVVVDNNQETDSPNQAVVEQAADPRVLYYRNAENLGMYQNWNRGIELARAPYVTFCHDDDLLLPGALRILLQLQPRLGDSCILSAYNLIDSEGQTMGTTSYRKTIGMLKPRQYNRYSLFLQFLGNVSCGDGCLYARRCLLEIGGYDPTLYPVADYAMNVVYSQLYGGYISNEPTSSYRVAVNESIQIYRENPTLFADMTRDRIHNRLKSKVGLPGKCVDRFISLLYKNNIISGVSDWKQFEADVHLNLLERLVMNLCRDISRISRYCLRV